jgi:hypothetical protein
MVESVAEFRQRLRQLRADSGHPTQAQMRKAIATFDVDKLAPATLSEFLGDVRAHSLPRWEFVRSYVAACLLYDGNTPQQVNAQLKSWAHCWKDLAAGTGAGVVTPESRQTGESAMADESRVNGVADESGRNGQADVAGVTSESRQTGVAGESGGAVPRLRRRWIRGFLVVLGSAAVGFGGGLVVAGSSWDRPLDQDPSLGYGICAEAITPSTQVGRVALLADTGPHGKPVQDRRIELRVQQHPERGWIAWAYLERTPSNLDRLWLDWSYLEHPGSQADYRQCGAQPVTENPGTPGILVSDERGRPRWFRACGQVPTEDRAPNQNGTFCTSWTRPRI